MDFNFVGFDGVEYNLSGVPSDVFSYKHFILLAYSDGDLYFCCFNSDFIKVEVVSTSLKISGYNGDMFFLFHGSLSGDTWPANCLKETFSLYHGYDVLYSSESLLPYKDILVTKNFALDIHNSKTILEPIVQEIHTQNNIVNSVFTDLFSILPVLIVVLVSFIGIRKGISWLFGMLRGS